MQIAYNKSVRKEKIRYIVIHDTGNKSKGADAKAHYNYYNTGNRNSSADVFCDSNGYLIINDWNKYCTWHCGDGKGKYGITNQNSVGVEICVNSDGDYNKAINNALLIVRQMMTELDIPIERVVRHYDASKKLCPASMSKDDWKSWKCFKEALSDDAFLVKTAAGLEDKTMDYLKSYAYGDALIEKLAKAITHR